MCAQGCSVVTPGVAGCSGQLLLPTKGVSGLTQRHTGTSRNCMCGNCARATAPPIQTQQLRALVSLSTSLLEAEHNQAAQ